MKLFVFVGGTVVYFILGAAIDVVFPGADMLGISVQGLVLSTLCLIGMLWLWVKLDLF